MKEDLDDLIHDILNDKPQVKPGAFSMQKPKTEEEAYATSLIYKRVPRRKKNPVCSTCSAKLKEGTWHWYYRDNLDGEFWWWCYKCMAAINCLPNEKEKLREQKYGYTRNNNK